MKSSPVHGRRRRGAVFILVLGILAALVGLVAEIAIESRASARAEMNRLEAQRARVMAESAIQMAVANLQKQDLAHTGQSDGWAKLGDAGSQRITMPGGSFRIQIVDASSRLNLNTAGQAQLKKLSLSDIQIDSLMDWREPGQNARPSGAKDAYYNDLPNPYNTKLAQLGSVDELLLVRGFTPEALYSTTGGFALAGVLTAESNSQDVNLNGQQKLVVTSASQQDLMGIGVSAQVAQAITRAQQQQPFNTFGDVFRVPQMDTNSAKALADNAALSGSTQRGGLINVNTASEPVLKTLGIDPSVASAIVARQSTPFKSLGELLDVPGVDLTAMAQLVDGVCVSSRTFEVRAIGEAGQGRYALDATLSLGDDNQVTITRIQPQPNWDVINRWGWQQTPTTQTSLSSGM